MTFAQLLSDWGLPALFLGTMAEGEAVAILGGAMAHRHLFSYESAALAVTGGAVAVDQILFHLGRHAARFAFVGRALARPAAGRVLRQIAARPTLSCLLFRFIYGFKTVGALAIGAAGVPALRFSLLDLVSSVLWGHLFVAIGYGAGRLFEETFGRLPLREHLGLVLSVLVLAVGALFVLTHRRLR